MSRKTTAATAFALINDCAATSTLRPVNWQVRNSADLPTAPMMVSAVMTSPPYGEALINLDSFLVRDINLASHRVMTDPAEFVADNPELAAFGRRQRNHVLVAGIGRDIDVDGLQ